MKKLLPFLVLLAAFLLQAAPPLTVTFLWNTPQDQPYTNLVYRLYGTTNLTAPTNQWPLLTVMTNPVAVSNETMLAFPLPIQPGAWFFEMSASNFWGESFFSQPASTPPVAPVLNNLQITR